MFVLLFISYLSFVQGGPAADSLKDQFCTDPRTMRKHAAYTEWADAYSCTRHRCQPGGRNLAIYTVGCKRVEAPESAIECEEVVEDTNMQFPYCCTRLRCLVVVRGEVWTRVLGQPWETLPAAPWSHMYKMKKPPPVDGTFLPKTMDAIAGPVYELAEAEGSEKVLRAKKDPKGKDCGPEEAVPRSVQTPDIVIALSTGSDTSKQKTEGMSKRKSRKEHLRYIDPERKEPQNEIDAEEAPIITERVPDIVSEEKYFAVVTKPPRHLHKAQQVSWTEVPRGQWNSIHQKPLQPQLSNNEKPIFHENSPASEENKERPSNLQALVDAIGTRMRDIENVVQKMSEKVQPPKGEEGSVERRSDGIPVGKVKQPNADADEYKRFTAHNKGSKYLHEAVDSTTERPLYIEDNNMNGYFSDAANNLLRRSNGPKEPAPTYMAPVGETRRTPPQIPVPLDSGETRKRKHSHKKKKSRKNHKKHRKEEKRFNKVTSMEIDRNVVSLEDNSAVRK